ncbi:MAG: hypothetical protein AAFY26_20845 [Cyanobacteria bacterium J06638_22]
MQESQLDTQAYVDVYPELFAKLKAAGWTGKVQQHDKPRWAREASLFVLNMAALDFIVQFEGLRIEVPSHVGKPGEYPNHCIKFYPGSAFACMKTSAADYDLDVEDILEAPDAFPVAESNGNVLFLTQSGRAAFIEQVLSGYARAPNPFVLLNSFLFNVDSGGLIEYKRGYFGQRITGRPWL